MPISSQSGARTAPERTFSLASRAMVLHLVFEKAHTASTRIRLVQMAPHLEQRGIACRVIGYPRGSSARATLGASVAAGDPVPLPPPRPPPPPARLLPRPAAPA